jgi:hypothetical protein
MSAILAATPSAAPCWRDVVWPKEHGSWSLALEPLALGLLVAPSGAGAAFAVTVVAGFFARRPLRIAWCDGRADRRSAARRALFAAAILGIAGLSVATALSGMGWQLWLLPSALFGAVFLSFDLRQSGREQYAELAGALAFAWLPAVFVMLAGGAPSNAAILAAAMLVRTVPTVLAVRAAVRARKNHSRPSWLPVLVATVAALLMVCLAAAGLCPRLAGVLALCLAVRAFALLVYPRPALRASTLGLIEAALGLVYVGLLVLAWR